MIINHTHRFVFIHIPKAAGTTVTRTLSQLTRYCDQEIGGTELGEAAQAYFMKRFGIRKHSSAEAVMNTMGRERYLSYFRFAFVRNPYTRLASAYHFLKHWSGLPPEFRSKLNSCETFERFLDSNLWTSETLGRGPDAMFQPQVRWLFSQGDNPELLVDFVGKTESMESDMADILERIGVSSLPLERGPANASPPYALPEEWRPEVIERIQQEYRRDFEVFGYPTHPPALTRERD